jgi:hypothetical protein
MDPGNQTFMILTQQLVVFENNTTTHRTSAKRHTLAHRRWVYCALLLFFSKRQYEPGPNKAICIQRRARALTAHASVNVSPFPPYYCHSETKRNV